jgi:hypothetical protein
MEGLVCLCLEAAPGYISLAVSAHPRPPATIASPLHTLFHTVPSSPSLELSTSPVALGAVPSFTKTLQVYFLLAALHNCTTTLPFGSALIPPSPTSFTFFLSKALDLEHSTVPVSSPCPRHLLRSPPLRSTLEVYSLLAAILAAIHISTTRLQLDALHTTVDSQTRSTIISSGYVDAEALYSIPLRNLSSPSLLLVSLLAPSLSP